MISVMCTHGTSRVHHFHAHRHRHHHITPREKLFWRRVPEALSRSGRYAVYHHRTYQSPRFPSNPSFHLVFLLGSVIYASCRFRSTQFRPRLLIPPILSSLQLGVHGGNICSSHLCSSVATPAPTALPCHMPSAIAYSYFLPHLVGFAAPAGCTALAASP